MQALKRRNEVVSDVAAFGKNMPRQKKVPYLVGSIDQENVLPTTDAAQPGLNERALFIDLTRDRYSGTSS